MQVSPTKPSEVLEAAKEFLASERYQSTNKRTYICYALDEVIKLYPESREAVINVQRYIKDCLEPSVSLEGWLSRQVEVYDYFYTSEDTEKKMYITRLAWIDHMIVLYKKQGR